MTQSISKAILLRRDIFTSSIWALLSKAKKVEFNVILKSSIFSILQLHNQTISNIHHASMHAPCCLSGDSRAIS